MVSQRHAQRKLRHDISLSPQHIAKKTPPSRRVRRHPLLSSLEHAFFLFVLLQVSSRESALSLSGHLHVVVAGDVLGDLERFSWTQNGTCSGSFVFSHHVRKSEIDVLERIQTDPTSGRTLLRRHLEMSHYIHQTYVLVEVFGFLLLGLPSGVFSERVHPPTFGRIITHE